MLRYLYQFLFDNIAPEDEDNRQLLPSSLLAMSATVVTNTALWMFPHNAYFEWAQSLADPAASFRSTKSFGFIAVMPILAFFCAVFFLYKAVAIGQLREINKTKSGLNIVVLWIVCLYAPIFYWVFGKDRLSFGLLAVIPLLVFALYGTITGYRSVHNRERADGAT